MTDHSLIISHNTQSPALTKLSRALNITERLLPKETLTEQDWAWWHGLDDIWKKIFTAYIYHWNKIRDICDISQGDYNNIIEHGVLELVHTNDLVQVLQLERISLITNEFNMMPPLILTDLSRLSKLTTLGLSCFKTPNLAPLVGSTGLTELTLCINQIQDITPLAGLTRLTELYLYDNPISPSDIAWLKNQLPNCSIYGGY